MFMPGLSGLATGFMQGMQDAEKKQEREGDKAYERSRLDAADKRAGESHVAQMGINDQQSVLNQQTIAANKVKTERDMEEYKNLHAWQKYATPIMNSEGNPQGILDGFMAMNNDPAFGMPYQVDYSRDATGKIVLDANGKTKEIRTFADGRQPVTVDGIDPKNVANMAMMFHDPTTRAKLYVEKEQEVDKENRQQKNKIVEAGINHDFRMKEIKEAGAIDTARAKLIDSLKDNPLKPLGASDLKTLFTEQVTTGDPMNGTEKTSIVYSEKRHKEFAEWSMINRRTPSMQAYNDWLASKPSQSTTQPVLNTQPQLPVPYDARPTPSKNGIGQPPAKAAVISPAVQSILNNYQLPR
ncbi:MAG: hypothetical protein Q7S87_04655 [Agitococcus sp.]|nr:hypothetical protein [Agitococcus sp.]